MAGGVSAINIGCSDEENSSKQEVIQTGNKKQSSSDSSDSETEVHDRKRRNVRRQRTMRGLAALLEAQKNDWSPPSPDDRRDGLYSRQLANIWNKVTLAKTSAMKDQVQEEKTKAVITESFLPKKTEKGRKKRPQWIKKERRKKKDPETVNISDEEDRTQNNSYRERSPTPPPTPTPDDNPTKKPRMARGCKKALNNLETLKKKVESGVFDDDEDDVMILEDVPPCTPESQKEISVKVRSRTGIQRFSMKRSFHRMMHDMASREGVAPDRLFFVHGDRTIYDYDSPTSIQLHVADILECLVKKDASSSSNDDADAEDPDAFNVMIQGNSYKSKHTFRIAKMQPLEKIMCEYAHKMAVRFEQLTFSFDGVMLSLRQTPGDVDLEDEECIDVTGL